MLLKTYITLSVECGKVENTFSVVIYSQKKNTTNRLGVFMTYFVAIYAKLATPTQQLKLQLSR